MMSKQFIEDFDLTEDYDTLEEEETSSKHKATTTKPNTTKPKPTKSTSTKSKTKEGINMNTNQTILTEKQAKLLEFYVNDISRYLNVADETTTPKRGRGTATPEKSKIEQTLDTLKSITNNLREAYINDLES